MRMIGRCFKVTEDDNYYDMGATQMAAILVLVFLMGVAAGYLLFHC